MKLKRIAMLAGLISGTLLIANLVNAPTNSGHYSNAYPAVVCPPSPAGVTTLSSIPSKATLFYQIGGGSPKLTKINSFRYSSVSNPIFLQSEGATPVSYQSRSGIWAGSVLCSSAAISQWFVGGTSDVSSRGLIYLVNSGLGQAMVDLFTWSENGKQSAKTIKLNANSSASVKLDSLAPGDSNIVVHVVARSGRVNSFLIDERGKGLQKLGGDSVNSVSEPAKKLVIAAIPQQLDKNKKSPNHYLRLFAPGVADANFTLELISSDGRFIPIGYNEQRLASGKVAELTLAPEVTNGAFAIRLTSDQPIVAAVRSRVNSNGVSDFIWSTPSPALGPMQIALAGIAPKVIFTGDAISVDLKVTYSTGKAKNLTIVGSDLIGWQVPSDAIAVTVLRASRENYAGALIAAKSGYAFFPVASETELAKRAIPTSNIQVLNP